MKLFTLSFLTLCMITHYALPSVAKDQLNTIHALNASEIIEKTHNLKNPVKVIFFYASWCGYCRKAMPIIAEAEIEKAGSIIAVSVDDNQLKALKYLNRQELMPFEGITLDGDKNSIEKELGIENRKGLPFYVIMGPDNEVKFSGNVSAESIKKLVLRDFNKP